ncbi:MAG TPA: phosphatase PAP2 family protein [Polyangiaceae bacterium]|nr:phosphatase PAP2 family protein [Polyangiaceae bacterium]
MLRSAQAERLPPPPAPDSEAGQQERDLLDAHGKKSARAESAIADWRGLASVRWNEIARDLVAKHRTSHPQASRVYALMSVAQYDASVAAWNNKSFYRRPAPIRAARDSSSSLVVESQWIYPSGYAAVASASASVLAYLFPDEQTFLHEKADEAGLSRIWGGQCFASDVSAGEVLGRAVAGVVVQRASADGADGADGAGAQGDAKAPPVTEGEWVSAPNDTPLLPLWGSVKPFLMSSNSQFRAPPPPAAGSPAFQSALAEVRKISDSRTPEQARLAALWADGAGSYSPAGHWNKIAADLIEDHGFDEARAARVLALLNMAMMDASIACWDTKYHYGVIRPSQADSQITTPVGLPNFPSYVSGHAAFSGAAAAVLGRLFPAQSAWLSAKAEEAATSRIYGGIHYRFDSEAGLAQGRAIAQLAIERAKSDGGP